MNKLVLLNIILSIFCTVNCSNSHTKDYSSLPVILWHGMGDSCCNPFSMGSIKKLIETQLPGIYVYSVRIGSNVVIDTEHGFFGNVNDQIKYVCEEIKNDPNIKGSVNAIGFSQGAQFLRGLVERCPEVKVRNLISIGGQHQGVFGLPHCPSDPTSSKLCEYIRKLLDYGAYESVIQSHLVQAQYWHDPLQPEKYVDNSIFLADINNEKSQNEDYKSRFSSLSNFVMVKFLRDSMVVPIESEWFGFYNVSQDSTVIPMEQTNVYKKDLLGLASMKSSGKLHQLTVDGDHLQFDAEWFVQQIIQPYLA